MDVEEGAAEGVGLGVDDGGEEVSEDVDVTDVVNVCVTSMVTTVLVVATAVVFEDCLLATSIKLCATAAFDRWTASIAALSSL